MALQKVDFIEEVALKMNTSQIIEDMPAAEVKVEEEPVQKEV